MKHTINIDRKFFEPIRNGEITLLIFKTKVIRNPQKDDTIFAAYGAFDVEAKITNYYYKTFEELTNEDAQKAGFLNKDFLEDELIRALDLQKTFNGIFPTIEDGTIFFVIEIEPYNRINTTAKVKLYNYNPEYDTDFYTWEE